MDKRSIIIFWKCNNKDYDEGIMVQGLDDCKIYFSSLTADELHDCIDFIKNIKSEKIVVLLHTNDPNKFKNEHLVTIKKYVVNTTQQKKIYLFGGGPGNNHPIYYQFGKYPKGILGNTEIDDNALMEKKDKLKEDHFEFVWNWYWNKLDLEYQKKKIINLWLPLAIDIQGLSEVTDETTRVEYLKGIETHIDMYADSLAKKWEEVKKILLPDDDKEEVLEEKYRLSRDEKTKVSFWVTEINSNNLKKFVKNNWTLKANNSNDPNFLPNWLQEVVNIIDKKIKESSKKPIEENEAAKS